VVVALDVSLSDEDVDDGAAVALLDAVEVEVEDGDDPISSMASQSSDQQRYVFMLRTSEGVRERESE
jgi:hypothetical protein